MRMLTAEMNEHARAQVYIYTYAMLVCRSVFPRSFCSLTSLRYSPARSAGCRSAGCSWMQYGLPANSHHRGLSVSKLSFAMPGEGASLEEVLGNWKMRGRSVGSHDYLTRCLYHSLKAASVQQLSPLQLVEVPQFQSFWQHLCGQVPSMSTNSAVMCLYSCAKYNFKVDTSIFSAIVSVCLHKSETIPPKAFGILLWSLYRLDLYQQSRPLVDNVVHRFHSRLLSRKDFKPQTFATVLWVLASSRTWPQFITEEVLKYVPEKVADFDFHSLSIVLWAVTTANLSLSDAFLKAAGDRAALLLLSQLPVISLVHCCWAFGSALYYHESFFSALTDRILTEPLQSPSFTPRLLSSMAWACARTGYYHARLLDHIAAAAHQCIHQFNSQDLGNLAYSYGILNHPSGQLLTVISQTISKPEMAANELACANVAIACLIHRLYPEPLLRQLMCCERVTALLQEGASKHLHFCIQMHSLLKVERPDLQRCVLQPPNDEIVTALVLAETMVNCQPADSVFHQNVCKALTQITGSTQHFTREALTTFSSFIDAEVILDHSGQALPIPSQWQGWSNPCRLLATAYPVKDNPVLWKEIDTGFLKKYWKVLYVSLPYEVCVASDWAAGLGKPSQRVSRKIAIEADGPRHYAVNCRHKLGTTVLKQRLLKAKGWDVIAIPHFEWQNLVGDQDRVNYLAQRLSIIIPG